MWNAVRILVVAGGAITMMLAAGFVMFVAAALRESGPPVEPADGIVALTGAPARIAEAGELLRQNKARRLLISGVNRSTSRDEVRRQAGLTQELFDCCVDTGYQAQDTVGNAEETRAWLEANKFKSLIVVTSNYHMPRSLAEFARVIPDARLIPYAVAHKSSRAEGWWRRILMFRVLAAEYIKFLPSAARLTITRSMRRLQPSPMHSGASENASAN